MTITVQELAKQLGGEVFGDRERELSNVAGMLKATAEQITFVADDINLRKLDKCHAGCIIVDPPRLETARQLTSLNNMALIVVDDPQAAFIQAMRLFRPERQRPAIGISPAAHIDPTARIGENTNIFPGAFVGPDAVIGCHCDIHPGAVIGAGCRIGDDSTIHPQVVLYPDVELGSRVIIHANAVIGADGFGYRFQHGRFEKIPQLGSVRIEDDVEIGACTTVDRGMIGATVVGEGTKLDNLVMIAHNCELGKHNAIVSQVGLAGSVTTGDYVRCAGQVGIADHLHLGTGCTIAAKAGVHKDVPAGQTHVGAPAGPIDEQFKIMMAVQKTPEMRHQIRQLERQVAELTRHLTELQDHIRQSTDQSKAA